MAMQASLPSFGPGDFFFELVELLCVTQVYCIANGLLLLLRAGNVLRTAGNVWLAFARAVDGNTLHQIAHAGASLVFDFHHGLLCCAGVIKVYHFIIPRRLEPMQ